MTIKIAEGRGGSWCLIDLGKIDQTGRWGG